MSIESFQGMHTPTCDGCGKELETEFDFHDAVNAKKAAGWHSAKLEGVWFDFCDECHEAHVKKLEWED